MITERRSLSFKGASVVVSTMIILIFVLVMYPYLEDAILKIWRRDRRDRRDRRGGGPTL